MDQCGSASGKHDVLGILGILGTSGGRGRGSLPSNCGCMRCHMVPHGASNWGNWGRDKNFNGAKMSQVLDTSQEANRITMA